MIFRAESLVVAGTVLATGISIIAQPARGQTQRCVPFRAIGGGTRIEKSVSPPGTGVTRDNWNTDFIVPSNQNFRRYVASILPLNGGEYNLQMNLKYRDNTADTVYNRIARLPERKTYSISGTPRINANPYQVNVQVGGVPVIGNSYVVSVSGCWN
ncbi:hypothetical protein J5X98_14705 [Leptothermofonsia sichuanensis E412]|uniref:hypothetical protein n=1 Tax=Leptothermofonsia sichuanensis TaxID=2917832 RepID=UPI001CA6EB46|nr:hypothetical protein [Leptothermofonsia sichuanensis]QZZ18721.1 hypothetical protein J5X98_14705 [Leptothermofonsia sichuanensis E412]